MYLLLVSVLPLAWLISEFYPRRWLRVLLGLMAMVMVGVFVQDVVTKAERIMDYKIRAEVARKVNAEDGAAMSDLISATVNQMESGNGRLVIGELRRLQETYRSSDNHTRYSALMSETTARLKPKMSSSLPAATSRAEAAD